MSTYNHDIIIILLLFKKVTQKLLTLAVWGKPFKKMFLKGSNNYGT